MCIVCFEVAKLTPYLYLKLGDVGDITTSPPCLRSIEAACGDNCRRFSDEELVSLLTNGAKPDWWKGENKICYNLVIKIFEMASGLSGNQGNMEGKSLVALDHRISLPKHVKNLKRKACSM